MLTNNELHNIVGGAITATLLNAIARLANTILGVGRAIGSSIRRAITKKYC